MGYIRQGLSIQLISLIAIITPIEAINMAIATLLKNGSFVLDKKRGAKRLFFYAGCLRFSSPFVMVIDSITSPTFICLTNSMPSVT